MQKSVKVFKQSVHYYIQFLTKICICEEKGHIPAFITKIPANFKLSLRTGKHMM